MSDVGAFEWPRASDTNEERETSESHAHAGEIIQ